MRRVIVLWLALCAALPAAMAESLEAIEACMRANVPETLQVREFNISSTDKAGNKRAYVGRLYARLEGERISAMMALKMPSDMRGAAYLVRESKKPGGDEEMYVYLPALKKTKRIVGSRQSMSLFGTDLTYSNLKQIAYAFSDKTLKFEREESIDSRPSWLLSMIPAETESPRYDNVLAWVDQKTCVVMKAEFRQGEETRKMFSTDPKYLAQSEGHWYLTQGLIKDLEESSSTVIRIDEVLSDKDLANRLFNPRGFHLGN